MVLDGAPLPTDASIRNFQQGKAGYIANAMEQALLLPRDIADLRTMRKHEVFLNLKRDLALVSPLTTLHFSIYHGNNLFYICTLTDFTTSFFSLFFFFFFFFLKAD